MSERAKVLWCTRLARAETDDERSALEQQMLADADLAPILVELRATRRSARDRQNAMERSIQAEARKLRAADGGAAAPSEVAGEVAARKQLDLKSLEFSGGGHYMVKRSVQMPKQSFRTMHKGYEEVRAGRGEVAPCGV